MGRVSDEDGTAAVEGGQRIGHLVDVVAEDTLRGRGGDQPWNRVVPVAVAAQQLGPFVVGAFALGRHGRRIGVDPAVLQEMAAPDTAGAPGLVGLEPVNAAAAAAAAGAAGAGDDDAPGGETGVAGSGVVGEEDPAYGGVDAVGTDHEFGLDPGLRPGPGSGPGGSGRGGRSGPVVPDGDPCGTPAGRSGVDEPGGAAGAHGAVRQPAQEPFDQGGPVQQHDGAAEPGGQCFAVHPGEPPAAGVAQSPVALPGGQGADLVAQPHRVEGPLRVGGEGDPGPDRVEGGSPLQDGDLPAVPVEGDGRGQPSDSAADHDGTLLRHGHPSVQLHL